MNTPTLDDFYEIPLTPDQIELICKALNMSVLFFDPVETFLTVETIDMLTASLFPVSMEVPSDFVERLDREIERRKNGQS